MRVRVNVADKHELVVTGCPLSNFNALSSVNRWQVTPVTEEEGVLGKMQHHHLLPLLSKACKPRGISSDSFEIMFDSVLLVFVGGSSFLSCVFLTSWQSQEQNWLKSCFWAKSSHPLSGKRIHPGANLSPFVPLLLLLDPRSNWTRVKLLSTLGPDLKTRAVSV